MTNHESLIDGYLSSPVADVGLDHSSGLRSLAWLGVPPPMKGAVWRLLCDLLPPTLSRREEEHGRRVLQYSDLVRRYGVVGSGEGADILRQLALDLPRHKLLLYHLPECVKGLERVLFVWCLRHPAVGYVQGMDDIAASFYCAFLAEAIDEALADVEADDFGAVHLTTSGMVCEDADLPLQQATITLAARADGTKPLLERLLWTNGGPLTEGLLRRVEADTYWCAGKVLGWTQDHFVNGLEGVHSIGVRVAALLESIDAELADHLIDSGVMVSQSTFQWHHCLLCRELPPAHALRLWDTYLSIGAGFTEFHIYVSLAIILHLRPMLMPPQVVMPTKKDAANHPPTMRDAPPLDVMMDIFKGPCRVVGATSDPRVPVIPPVYWVDERISEAYILQDRSTS